MLSQFDLTGPLRYQTPCSSSELLSCCQPSCSYGKQRSKGLGCQICQQCLLRLVWQHAAGLQSLIALDAVVSGRLVIPVLYVNDQAGNLC